MRTGLELVVHYVVNVNMNVNGRIVLSNIPIHCFSKGWGFARFQRRVWKSKQNGYKTLFKVCFGEVKVQSGDV